MKWDLKEAEYMAALRMASWLIKKDHKDDAVRMIDLFLAEKPGDRMGLLDMFNYLVEDMCQENPS